MSSVDFKYSIGDILRDKVSGLEGVVMVRAHYSSGCHHYGIAPRAKKENGELYEWVWLDQPRFVLVETGAVSFNVNPQTVGGPNPSQRCV